MAAGIDLPALVQRVIIDPTGVNAGAAQAESRMAAMGSQFTAVGGALTKGVTLPLAAVGAMAIASAMDVGKATTDITRATGATGDKLNELSGIMKQAAVTSGDSFDHMSQAVIKYSTQLDLSGENLQGLTNRTGELNRMLGAQAPTIEQVTAAMNAFGIKGDDVNMSLDHIYTISQKTGVGMNDLMGVVVRSGPAMAGAFHLTLDQATTLFAEISRLGPRAAQAATMAMTTFAASATKAGQDPQVAFIELVKKIQGTTNQTEATDMAFQAFGRRGGAVMLNAIKENRVNWDKFSEVLKTSAHSIDNNAEATESFGTKLAKLKNAAEVALAPIGSIMLTQIKNVLDDIIPIVQRFADWLGALPAPAQKTVVAIMAIAAAIGPVLLITGKLLDSFARMAATAGTIGSKLGIGASAGAGAGTAGVDAAATQAEAGAHTEAAAATEAHAAAQASLDEALVVGTAATDEATVSTEALDAAMLANPVGLVVAAILALGAAFYLAYEKVKPFREFIDGLWTDFLKGVDEIKVAWGAFTAAFSGEGITSTGVIGEVEKLGVSAREAWGGIVDAAKVAWSVLEPILKFMAEAWKTYIVLQFEIAVGIVKGGWEVLQGVFKYGAAIIGVVLQAIGDVIKGLVIPVVDELMKQWASLWPTIGPPLKEAGAIASDVFGSIAGWITDHVVPALETFGKIIGGVFSLAADVIETAWRFIRPVFDFLVMVIKDVLIIAIRVLATEFRIAFAIIVEVVKVAWAVGSVIFNAIAAGIRVVIAVVSAVASAFRTAWNAVSSAVVTAWHVVEPILKVIGEVVAVLIILPFALAAKAIQTAWNLIVAAVRAAWNFMRPVFTAIATAVEDVLGATFDFLYDDVVKPVWTGIRAFIGATWAAIRIIWEAIRTYIIGPLQAVFLFLWHNVVEPVWRGIQAAINLAWNGVKVIWEAIRTYILGPLQQVFLFLWHNVIEPVWNGIQAAIRAAVDFVWHQVLEPVSSWISGAFTDTWHVLAGALEGIWQGISDTAGRIWGGITDTISGVINTVKGLVANFLKIADDILGAVGLGAPFAGLISGLTGAPPSGSGGGSSLRMAEGGTLPIAWTGVGSGMKTAGAKAIVGEGHPAYPEYVIPTDPRHRENAAHLYGALGHDLGFYATGGVLGGGGARQPGTGGFWEDVKSAAGSAVGAVGGFVKDAAGAGWSVVNGVMNIVKGAAADAADALLPKMATGPDLLHVPADVFMNVRSKFIDWIRAHDIAASAPGYATGSGYQLLIDYLKSTGVPFNYPSQNQLTGGVHAAGSYHYAGLAADFTSPQGAPGMMSIFKAFDAVGAQLAELFHTPAGYSWKSGQKVAPIAAADHYDHVHSAVEAATHSLGTPMPSGGDARAIGQQMAAARGWTGPEWDALNRLWDHESGWNVHATNPSSGAYGIPQALPASKLASAGADWHDNPATQIKWGLDYIAGRYRDPLGAMAHENQYNWYEAGGLLPIKLLDAGGILEPGLNLAINATGGREVLHRGAGGAGGGIGGGAGGRVGIGYPGRPGFVSPDSSSRGVDYDPSRNMSRNTTAQNYEILRTLGQVPAAPMPGATNAYLQALSLDKSLAAEGTSPGLPQNRSTVQWLRREILSEGTQDAISEAMATLHGTSRSMDRVGDRLEDWFEDNRRFGSDVHVLPGAFHFPITIQGDADDDKIHRMTEKIEERLEAAVGRLLVSVRSGAH